MVGVRADFIYQFRSSSGTGTRNLFVNVDADSTSLILNSVVNEEAPGLTPINSNNFFIPPASGRTGKNISARGVQVEYTDALPPGISSPRVWIVVFQRPVFIGYAVGQTGTLKGLPVECIAKFDGRPDINGQFGF